MNQAASAIAGTNGASTAHELFALTDEQILEIEPEAQDVSLRESGAHGDGPAPVLATQDTSTPASEPMQTAQAGLSVPLEPPAWLAEKMNDPQRGAEARALWEGAQRAEREAASFREVFAKPEEARAAAQRAQVLDDIDLAYFAGDATQRAQLATMMMHEDPAAFREMVFEGLRALEAAEQPGRSRSIASAVGATLGSPSARGNAAQPGGASPAPTALASSRPQLHNDSAQQAHLAAYAAFEKSANEDLERSVGNSIERALEQALPATGRADSTALKGRMTAAIRQDVEKALQGDRQLGEQVAQILSAKRLDGETRAQIVRLIGERAQQLVPIATKRALKDWTQTTLAAHRGNSARTDAASARREVTPVAPVRHDSQAHSAQRKEAARSVRTDGRESAKGRVDYRRLSDDQILDL